MSKPINQRPKRPAAGAHPLPKRSKIVLVANMRSTPLPGATLCIRPYAGIQKDNYQIPFHGITFNQVQEAFNSVQGKDDNVSYVFEFPGSENEWEKVCSIFKLLLGGIYHLYAITITSSQLIRSTTMKHGSASRITISTVGLTEKYQMKIMQK